MVSTRQISISSYHRDAWLEIDLGAVETNVSLIKSWLSSSNKNCKLMAVVKSDAYGHGAVDLAEVLTAAGAQWFGVASVDEGCQLRDSGLSAPIMILGPSPFWAVENAVRAGLGMTVTDPAQLKDILSVTRKISTVAKLHLKIDTGMHRIGIAPDKARDLMERIECEPALRLESIFSHLAKAGDREATEMQNNKFCQTLRSMPVDPARHLLHLASSESTRSFPFTHHDMVRVGLFLYGLEARSSALELCPAMSVKARINHTNTIQAGEPVGYNWTWTPERETRLASIPIGYADGVDRRLSNKMIGMLDGKHIRQVGLISMDQMLFDITDLPEAEIGDVITLVGSANKETSLASWAEELETITYELACRLRARLPRIYTRPRQISTKASGRQASTNALRKSDFEPNAGSVENGEDQDRLRQSRESKH